MDTKRKTDDVNPAASPFGEVIYAYTPDQAVADGVLADVTLPAMLAGFKCRVLLSESLVREFMPGGRMAVDRAADLVAWLAKVGRASLERREEFGRDGRALLPESCEVGESGRVAIADNGTGLTIYALQDD